MTLINKKSKALLLIMLTSAVIGGSSEASIVKISNTAESAVFIRVIPGSFDMNSTYCWSCFSSSLGSQQCRTKNLYIPAEGTGTDNFTIAGTQGGILFNGICGNLSTSKDYEVTLYDTSLGVGCSSKEI